jgi:hypothetical protein
MMSQDADSHLIQKNREKVASSHLKKVSIQNADLHSVNARKLYSEEEGYRISKREMKRRLKLNQKVERELCLRN